MTFSCALSGITQHNQQFSSLSCNQLRLFLRFAVKQTKEHNLLKRANENFHHRIPLLKISVSEHWAGHGSGCLTLSRIEILSYRYRFQRVGKGDDSPMSKKLSCYCIASYRFQRIRQWRRHFETMIHSIVGNEPLPLYRLIRLTSGSGALSCTNIPWKVLEAANGKWRNKQHYFLWNELKFVSRPAMLRAQLVRGSSSLAKLRKIASGVVFILPCVFVT